MSRTLNQILSTFENGDGGLLTNPFFDISQQNGTTGSTANAYYFADQWVKGHSGMSTCTSSKYAGAVSAPFERFQSAGISNIATGKVSYSSAEYLIPYQQIVEGVFFMNSGWGAANAKPITVVMAFYSNWTGTASLAVQQSGGTRTYVTTYPVSIGFQYITITIPGDTGGTWVTGNVASLVIMPFTLSGSTYHASSLNTWNTPNYISSATSTNWSLTAGNQISLFYCNAFIGNIPFRNGTDAGVMDFIFSVKRPYDIELLRCQRYYEILAVPVYGYGNSVGGDSVTWHYKATKRAAPTIGAAGGSAWTATNSQVDGFTAVNANPGSPVINAGSTASARM